jgi:choline-glycine betaine transporter
VVIFWGALTGAVAAIMLVIGGDEALNGIQNITFIGALPFTIVLILLCFALYKDLRNDPMMRRETKGAEVLEDAVVTGVRRHQGDFELQIKPTAPTPEPPPDHKPY